MKSEYQFLRRPHALILLLAAGAFVLLSCLLACGGPAAYSDHTYEPGRPIH